MSRIPKIKERATSRAEIEAFLTKLNTVELGPATGGRGRLIFALDATMSRQPTWDTACRLQADMFKETQAIGGLDVQLLYFRGLDECRASRWVSDPKALTALMERISCSAGETQIRKVLMHARTETEKARVQAMIFVGDSCEEEDDKLFTKASELGMRGVPVFMFQEGDDHEIERVFREIARRTRGAHCRFDKGAVNELRELLRAVAVYAAGGMKALGDLSAQRSTGAAKLLGQMKAS
jgi:hypothetical protein